MVNQKNWLAPFQHITPFQWTLWEILGFPSSNWPKNWENFDWKISSSQFAEQISEFSRKWMAGEVPGMKHQVQWGSTTKNPQKFDSGWW